jgi:hypothetical protein
MAATCTLKQWVYSERERRNFEQNSTGTVWAGYYTLTLAVNILPSYEISDL